MGDLQLDFFKQDRLLIDGIPIKIKMIPARDVFTLMTKSGVTEEYSLKLVKNFTRYLLLPYCSKYYTSAQECFTNE